MKITFSDIEKETETKFLCITIMRADILACPEFKEDLTIKIEQVRPSGLYDIFISRMRTAREEVRKADTRAGSVCNARNLQHECRIIMAYTQTHFARGIFDTPEDPSPFCRSSCNDRGITPISDCDRDNICPETT